MAGKAEVSRFQSFFRELRFRFFVSWLLKRPFSEVAIPGLRVAEQDSPYISLNPKLTLFHKNLYCKGPDLFAATLHLPEDSF